MAESAAIEGPARSARLAAGTDYERFRERKLHERPGFAYVTYLCTIPLDFDRVPEHWHDQMEVIYVKAGRGVVSLDFERHEVGAGTIVVVCPGRVHAIEGVPGERMEYENIIFSLEAFDSRMEDDWCRDNVLVPLREGTLSFDCVLRPGGALHDEAARALDAADAASAERGPGYTLAVKGRVYLFFRALYAHAERGAAVAPNAVAERLKPVLREVKLHFDKPISVREAAGLAGYSAAHFMRVFRRETGQTFVSYLRAYRLSEAEAMLRRTSEPISAVAEGCGFDSVPYFTRSFRAAYGCAPLAYRKRWAAAAAEPAPKAAPGG